MAKNGYYTRRLCDGHFGVILPFFISDRSSPKASSDWPRQASTRRWSHFRRVYPVLATRLLKVLVSSNNPSLPDNGRKGCSTTGPHSTATRK